MSERRTGSLPVGTVAASFAAGSGSALVTGVAIGPLSLGAVVGVALCGVLWLVAVRRGAGVRPGVGLVVLLLCGQLVWQLAAAVGSRYWSGADVVQQAVAALGFVGAIVLGAGMSRGDRVLLLPRLDVAARAAVLGLAAAFTLGHAGPVALGPGDRVVALAALPPLAWSIARWRAGHAPSRAWAIGTVVLVALTLSRTAAACALLLLVVSAPADDLRQRARRYATVAACLAGSWWALHNWAPLRDRFFTGDVSLEIGPWTINAMGRTRIWEHVLAGVAERRWTGWGLAASRLRTEEVAPGVGHPHQDLLRILFEGGVVGLALWTGAILVLVSLVRRAGRASRGTDEHAVARAGLYALVATLLTAMTDNSLVYLFVLVPTGLLVGVAVSVAPAARRQRSSSSGDRPRTVRYAASSEPVATSEV